ncbi:MAG: hypothetical protein Q8K43_07480, partial [Sulfurimicrobium sp.]|nr:hypothetical protein [Sulfurimicrobium sp.]
DGAVHAGAETTGIGEQDFHYDSLIKQLNRKGRNGTRRFLFMRPGVLSYSSPIISHGGCCFFYFAILSVLCGEKSFLR